MEMRRIPRLGVLLEMNEVRRLRRRTPQPGKPYLGRRHCPPVVKEVYGGK